MTDRDDAEEAEFELLTRRAPATNGKPAPAKRRKWQKRFIAFPAAWMDQLKTCDRAATFKLALLLVYEHWHTNGAKVRLTNALAARWGISPDAKRRALTDLERRALVGVERCERKTPLVAVLHADETAALMRM